MLNVPTPTNATAAILRGERLERVRLGGGIAFVSAPYSCTGCAVGPAAALSS